MKRFKDILCVLERGEASRPALECAVMLAEDNQASLTVVDVIPHVAAGIGMPDGGPISADLQTAMLSVHEARLKPLVDPYRKRIEIQTKVLAGTSFLEIIREVLRNGRDLVVKIPESPDWLDRLFWGDDMHLLRKCPCPVWIIKPQAPKSYRRILAAVDVDESNPSEELGSRHALNRQILEMASSLALLKFAELHIVHAWHAIFEDVFNSVFADTPEEKVAAYVEQERWKHQKWLDTLMREVNSSLDKGSIDYLQPQAHLLKGSARKEIPALAKLLGIDLIVMGTVARTGIQGFIMGNTAETILNQIDCSVLAIKPQGFVTPVTLEG
ncbi:MAG: universal stress protein [Sulfitobacter sp.]|nr:universal stress protein [Sulfitobacter sp.]